MGQLGKKAIETIGFKSGTLDFNRFNSGFSLTAKKALRLIETIEFKSEC